MFRVDFESFVREVFSAESPPVEQFVLKTHAELLETYPLPERAPPARVVGPEPGELPRRVLLLYKRSESESLEETPLFDRVGVVLEYLGLIPVYKPVEEGLPHDTEMASYLGIVTWHTKPHMGNAQHYGEWLSRQLARGKRVVMLEHYGATYDLDTQERSTSQKPVFRRMDIDYIERPVRRQDHQPAPRIVDESMLGYERDLSPTAITYQDTYHSVGPDNRVFLSFADRDYGDVDLGIITPNGGVRLEESPFYFPPHDTDRIALVNRALDGEIAPEIAEQTTVGSWQLNPCRFFSEALGIAEMPVPDITTLNGSRIFFAGSIRVSQRYFQAFWGFSWVISWERPCGSSWKTRSVFQGAVGAFCASTAPSASTGPVRGRQDGSQGGEPGVMSNWTAASSDCGRDDVHIRTADLYRPNARFTPERQRYQVLTPFGKLGYSLFAHIDGDAFGSVSQIDNTQGFVCPPTPRLAAVVLRQEAPRRLLRTKGLLGRTQRRERVDVPELPLWRLVSAPVGAIGPDRRGRRLD